MVANHDLHQVVELSGEVMTFEHLRNLAKVVAKSGDHLGLVMGERDLNEAQEVEAQGLSVEEGGIALNDPLVFELAQSLLQSGRREVDLPSELSVSGTSVLLQEGEKPSVDRVERVAVFGAGPGGADGRRQGPNLWCRVY